jgi:microcystin-dependent protein
MTPFLGQLMLVAFNYAPTGYQMCNGQTLGINQYTALFSLLGTTYGGNGVNTFQLPNLQGRTPVGVGNGISYGEVAGTDAHTLISAEVPPHTHALNATTQAASTKPGGNAVAAGGGSCFTSPTSLVAMNSATIGNAGGSQPHENRQPFLVMTWVIAMVGIFPSRS